MADTVGGRYGVPEIAINASDGNRKVTLSNQKAGLYLEIPVNPESIKWDGELVMNKHDTKAGFHYQFIKYRRTNGRMNFSTGSGRGTTFGKDIDDAFGGGPTQTAYEYLMRFGWVIEQWMKKAVIANVGPLRLTDHFAGLVDSLGKSRPLTLDVVPSSFPGFGPQAGQTSYSIAMSFDILGDYVDQYDMSQVKVDVNPALGRAQDAVYVASANDTVDKIAKKYYGDAAMGVLIRQISQNDRYIDKDGNIKAGARLVIPYAPIPREYRTFGQVGETRYNTSEELGGAVTDLLGSGDLLLPNFGG
jgi:phage tail protein X